MKKKIKVVHVMPQIGMGGAERQLCMLAVLLKERGYDVEFLTYYDYDFYRDFLDKANIPHTTITAGNKLSRIVAIRKAIRHQRSDVVIAYQETPSLFAELAGLPKRDFALIVSERSSNLRENFGTKRRFFFHRLSDAVVCNSFTQTKFIAQTAPWLVKRTATIINCVDIYKFKPADVQTPADNEPISILVIGNFRPEKNPLALVLLIFGGIFLANTLPYFITKTELAYKERQFQDTGRRATWRAVGRDLKNTLILGHGQYFAQVRGTGIKPHNTFLYLHLSYGGIYAWVYLSWIIILGVRMIRMVLLGEYPFRQKMELAGILAVALGCQMMDNLGIVNYAVIFGMSLSDNYLRPFSRRNIHNRELALYDEYNYSS
jgi:hypothetical protein